MSCPAFARDAARLVQQNEDATDAAILIVDATAYVLATSIFLSPLAVQLSAISVALTLLQNDCDGVASLQAVARRAAKGCDVMIVVCSIGGIVAGLTLNAPAAAFFLGAGALYTALRLVLAPLGAGRSPGLDAVEGFIEAAGNFSGTDTTTVRGFIRGANDAMESSPVLRQKAEDAVDEEEAAANPNAPTFPTWNYHTDGPPGFSGASVNGTANAYSRAYQEMAEAAYATDPNVDLRPWLLHQTAIDLRQLTSIRTALRGMYSTTPLTRYRRFGESIDEAIRRLTIWQTTASMPPLGAWSRSSFSRVVRSSEPQNNVPVVVPSDDDGGGMTDGDTPGWLPAAAAAAAGGLYFLFSK